MVVTKLYKNYTIYYFFKGKVGGGDGAGGEGGDVKLRERGLPKSNKCEQGGRGVQILVIL